MYVQPSSFDYFLITPCVLLLCLLDLRDLELLDHSTFLHCSWNIILGCLKEKKL